MLHKRPTQQEIIARQHLKANPLMAVLIGTVGKLEEALEIIDDLNTLEGDAAPICRELSQWVDNSRAFIEEMAVAKLYEPMILKVQRPITTNDPDNQLLMYNEDRSLMEQMVFDDPNLYSWFGDDYKMYVKARLWVSGQLQLIKRVENQSW